MIVSLTATALIVASTCMSTSALDTPDPVDPPAPAAGEPVHFADGRFFNPPPDEVEKSAGEFLRWRLDRLLGKRAGSGDGQPAETVPNDGSSFRLADGSDRVCWIGHSTVLVQIDGVSILTDPIWGDLLIRERRVPPGIALDRLPPIDAVLVSHNHFDHLDSDTIKKLGDDPAYLVPLGLDEFFTDAGKTKVHALDWWESFTLKGVRLTLVPARHWSRRGLLDKNKSLWGGWVVEGARHKVYYSGDTGAFGGFARIGERFPGIDVALLAVGAYEPRWFMAPQHMNPDEAGQAFLDVGARILLPVHWGMFVLSDEPLDDPPEKLRAWWSARAADLAAQGKDLWIFKAGETRVIP